MESPYWCILVLACLWMPTEAAYSGAPDNRGTEFILGFMENRIGSGTYYVELFITTSRTTSVNVKVTAPRYPKLNINFNFKVTAGYVKQLLINRDIRQIGTGKGTKAIWVQADDEVVVYGVNKEVYSCDAFVGLPVDILDTEYYAITWYPPSLQTEMLVVGVNDSTTVTFRVGSAIGSGYVEWGGKRYYKGKEFSVAMNRFDTVSLKSSYDLTGTYIKGTKPISVFSGNRKTRIGSGGSSDHLVEHLTPVSTWGKRFITVPIPTRTTGDYFKIIASEDRTTLKITGYYNIKTTLSRAGDVYMKLFSSKAYCLIETDKPVFVIQFCLSQQSSREPSDPMMMLIPPIEQYAADYTYTTPKYSLGSYENYYMFVVKNSEKSGLRVDGKAFPSTTKYNAISGTEYVAGYITVGEGTHTVRHTSPIAVFGGYMYGRAKYETYGVVTGMRMAAINTVCVPSPTVVGDGIDNDCDGLIDEEMCTVENKRKDDDGDGKSDEDCATPPPIDGQWGAWSSYSACSITCKSTTGGSTSGTITRTRQCNNPAPKYDGKQCIGDATQSTSCAPSVYCPVNGGLTSWSAWGTCSATCAGSKTRKRSCTNPSPQYNGLPCTGALTESVACGTTKCPVDGQWGNWGSYGSCSVTCGGGRYSRSRLCNNPAPAYNGATCSGSSTQTSSCNTQNCPVDGAWGSWGSYGRCTVTCGGGSQSRTRACSNPAPAYGGAQCVGDTTQRQSCNTNNCPIDGAWGNWGAYGTCSLTCGGGTKRRTRACNNPAPAYNGAQCPGDAAENADCNTHNCPIDGAWGNWGSYGTCSLTCGGGTQTRTRTCDSPAPAYNGAQCPGDASQSQSCNTQNCPIDGAWGSWGSYGTCSVTCGGGSQSRSRACDSPTPAYGGAQCSGDATENRDCNTLNCPIDGAWGNWGSYGTCSLTCGGGTQTRTRTCDSPAPAYNGAQCPGDASQSQSCNTQNCPIDGAWGSWGSYGTCSVTCGGGTQRRTRSCNNPAPAYGGAQCPGDATENRNCNTHNCPIDGAWGSWGSYGSCTVTCGGGTQRRTRTCDSPAPAYNGAQCPGDNFENQDCNTHNCPIDGGFSSWSTWSTCTVSCGGGTSGRTRSCTNPSPAYGGASCSGDTSESRDCNTQVCIIDGAWGTWNTWGSCTKTCETGTQSRSRSCDNPAPANGGLPCSGTSSEFQNCNTQSCPVPLAGQYFNKCPNGWFTCESGQINCIQMEDVCDCQADCSDESDEKAYANCPADHLAKCIQAGAGNLVLNWMLTTIAVFLAGFIKRNL